MAVGVQSKKSGKKIVLADHGLNVIYDIILNNITDCAIPLFRAILCNDSLIKKLEELQRTEEMYRGLVNHTRRVLMGYYDLVRVCKGRY